MSTKIWTAYKLKSADLLWELIHDIRLRGESAVVEELKELYALLSSGVKTDTENYLRALEVNKGNEALARVDVVQRILRDGYKDAAVSSERGFFDFDVSVAFRQYQGEIYLIPYCDMRMRRVLDFLSDDPRLCDYHYQNQTDRPENISDEEWAKRERIWDGMDKNDVWKDVLILDICSWQKFWMLDPYFDVKHAGVFDGL